MKLIKRHILRRFISYYITKGSLDGGIVVFLAASRKCCPTPLIQRNILNFTKHRSIGEEIYLRKTSYLYLYLMLFIRNDSIRDSNNFFARVCNKILVGYYYDSFSLAVQFLKNVNDYLRVLLIQRSGWFVG